MSFPPPDHAHDEVAPRQETPEAPTSAPPVDASVRAGDVTPAWRLMLGLGWVAAFFAYAGIWQASVQIGIGTWWVGPRAQPTNLAITLLPFFLSLLLGLMVVFGVKHVIRWNAVGVAAAVLISIPDFSRSVGLGAVELAVAGFLGLITLASLSGRYRVADVPPPLESAPLPGNAPFDPASR